MRCLRVLNLMMMKKRIGPRMTWIDKVKNALRLFLMGDLNGWVGDRVREDITSFLLKRGFVASIKNIEEQVYHIIHVGCKW